MESYIFPDSLKSVSGMEILLMEKQSDEKTTDKDSKRIPSPNPWYFPVSTPQESYKDHIKTICMTLGTFPNDKSEIIKLL